ncbi:MAG: MCE family protein, partial [Hymenobacteraceae bacterium]|nr:MCE family protein [Hymenobacteraceae bacterium]
TKLNSKNGLVDKLLTDTAVFNQLQRAVAQLEQATQSASAMTQNLEQTSRKLDNTNNAAGVLLNDEEFARQLKSTMRNLETSSQKLDENLKALQGNILFRGYFRKQEEARQEQQENNK